MTHATISGPCHSTGLHEGMSFMTRISYSFPVLQDATCVGCQKPAVNKVQRVKLSVTGTTASHAAMTALQMTFTSRHFRV